MIKFKSKSNVCMINKAKRILRKVFAQSDKNIEDQSLTGKGQS